MEVIFDGICLRCGKIITNALISVSDDIDKRKRLWDYQNENEINW